MPRLILMNDEQDRVLYSETVHPIHLADQHSALQVLERLGWAVDEDSDRLQGLARARAPRRGRMNGLNHAAPVDGPLSS